MGQNVATIYDGLGRRQEAVHNPSTMMERTLENVEAELEAHRIALRPLEEKYYQLKGVKPPSFLSHTAVVRSAQVEEETKQLIYRMKKSEVGPRTQKQVED